jgi:hypothetical protein
LAPLCLALGLSPGLVVAAESRIELRDGSVISADLVGVGNGVYRVRSATLGEVTIPESAVLAIRPATAGAAAPTSAATSAAAPNPAPGAGAQTVDLAAIQQQLLDNPQTMEAITRLQSDPGIQAALADPQFVAMIMSGNVEALRTDPRFQRLLENPAIRALIGQVLGP